MRADSVRVDIWLTLCFARKWENLLFINMPYVTIFVIVGFL